MNTVKEIFQVISSVLLISLGIISPAVCIYYLFMRDKFNATKLRRVDERFRGFRKLYLRSVTTRKRSGDRAKARQDKGAKA